MFKNKKLIIAGVVVGAFFIMLDRCLASDSIENVYIDLNAIVPEVSEIKIIGNKLVDFGSVTLNENSKWIEGVTNTPNSIDENDPWLVTTPVVINAFIANNIPAEIYIYTKHELKHDGMINDRYINQYPFAAQINMRAWVDIDNTGVVTSDPNANWVWILDESKKQRLFQYPIVYNENMSIYVRGCFDYPKVAGVYNADVYMEIMRL